MSSPVSDLPVSVELTSRTARIDSIIAEIPAIIASLIILASVAGVLRVVHVMHWPGNLTSMYTPEKVNRGAAVPQSDAREPITEGAATARVARPSSHTNERG